MSKPAPEGVDRYVPPPAERSRIRSRSPRRRGDGGGRGRGRERGGREAANRRPRKTQEDLDKEMEDYWGPTQQAEGQTATAGTQNGVGTTLAPAAADEDIDMGIE